MGNKIMLSLLVILFASTKVFSQLPAYKPQSEIFKEQESNSNYDKLKQEYQEIEKKIIECNNQKARIVDSITLINDVLKATQIKQEDIVEYAPDRDENGQIIEKEHIEQQISVDTSLYKHLLFTLEKRLRLINTDPLFERLIFLKKKIDEKEFEIKPTIIPPAIIQNEVSFSEVCIIGGIFSFLALCFVGIYPAYFSQSFALWINGIDDKRKRRILKAFFILAYACHYILVGIWLLFILSSISSDRRKNPN